MDNIDLDRTEDLTINMTRRWEKNCHKIRKDDGAKCVLYSPHYGDHKTKNLSDSFTDDEAE